MKLKFFLILTISISALAANAQRPRSAMGKPYKFLYPSLYQQKLETNDLQFITDRPWIVYVNNALAQFYNEPGGAINSYKARFMEKLVVVEVRNDYLRLVKDDQISPDGILSKSMSEVGWLHQDNLLMSDLALKGNDYRYVLAYVCDNMVMRIQKEGFHLKFNDIPLRVYHDPKFSHINDKLVEEGEYYYVYKTSDSGLLIGKRDRIDPLVAGEDLLGWIASPNVFLWESRLALEPNWEVEAAEERKEKRIFAQLFIDPISAAEFAKGKQIESAYRLWAGDIFEKRYQGNIPRFPLITLSNNILQVGLFGIESHEIKNIQSRKLPHYVITNDYLTQPIVFNVKNQNNTQLLQSTTNNPNEERIRFVYAYTPKFHSELGFPAFRFVLLLTRFEVQEILGFYNLLRLSAKDKRTFYQFLTQRLQQRYQNNVDGYFDLWTVDQAYYALTGITLNSKEFSQLKLYDLLLEETSDSELFDAFLVSVEQAIARIEPYIKSSVQGISFLSNSTVFYWLPLNFFL